MRSLFILAIGLQGIWSVFLCGREERPSFHVLIVFDKDSSKLHQIDARKIENSFKNIARSLKAPVDVLMVERKRYSSARAQKWSARIRQGDIAIVYYSGPRAKNSNYEGSWPSIQLSSNIVPIVAMSNIIPLSRPKLSLVIADCYDKIIKTDRVIRRMIGVPFKKTHSPHRVEKLRKIWLGASGNLTICSHQRGEPGFGIIQGRQYSGGVFTEALLQELTAYRKLSEFPLALPTSMMKFARLEPQNIKCLSSIED